MGQSIEREGEDYAWEIELTEIDYENGWATIENDLLETKEEHTATLEEGGMYQGPDFSYKVRGIGKGRMKIEYLGT